MRSHATFTASLQISPGSNPLNTYVRERIAREKREKALREILDAKPTFRDVPDGVTFVREVRSEDKKRDARLGLV
jgi:hypothetical protein